jgi:hypothetical protein
MNLATPQPPETAEGTFSPDDFNLGVAIMYHLEPFMPLSNFLLHHLLVAGLTRADIAPTDQVTFYRPAFSVHLFKALPRDNAVAAIKTALTQIPCFLDLSCIAIHTDDLAWLTVHGLGSGDINFPERFLRLEDMKACSAERAIHQERYLKIFASMQELLGEAPRANQPPNPEEPQNPS